MPRIRVHDLVVSVEPIDYSFGHWCRKCLLPSGMHVKGVVTIGPRSELRDFYVCTDCKSFQVDPSE
jgi:hypothetical protein